jgi:GTPase
MKSGFVSVVGRPNVGKSTLVNQICGLKVSIVSDKPQTTRINVRGVMNRPGAQLVFVDTPGLHKPVTALGERLNASASEALSGVDVVCFVLDATKPFGKGDRWVSTRVPKDVVIVVNKTDIASPEAVLAQLTAASSIDASAFFPISAATGEGVDVLLDHLVSRMQEGPQFFPDDMLTDQPEAVRVAELVREQLLALTEQELPYSIATRVSEWEWPRVRCEILVERDSQKGMVIGKKGALLKAVGIAVRQQMPPGAFLELFVKVDKNWQHRPDRVERLLGVDGD